MGDVYRMAHTGIVAQIIERFHRAVSHAGPHITHQAVRSAVAVSQLMDCVWWVQLNEEWFGIPRQLVDRWYDNCTKCLGSKKRKKVTKKLKAQIGPGCLVDCNVRNASMPDLECSCVVSDGAELIPCCRAQVDLADMRSSTIAFLKAEDATLSAAALDLDLDADEEVDATHFPNYVFVMRCKLTKYTVALTIPNKTGVILAVAALRSERVCVQARWWPTCWRRCSAWASPRTPSSATTALSSSARSSRQSATGGKSRSCTLGPAILSQTAMPSVPIVRSSADWLPRCWRRTTPANRGGAS